ncbi:hypothetical protein Acsp06_58450 [Actinomycetospora sp. NBRC 106375]|uniref:hypothetical protein n=1 Tax=Actinomycetospora sp. NBRC 106375 TaxID=3032207 RepID=UPI0024A07927|nr:hypothetical protein [Actinomycetospora sp. NBRC 106375]GLZ49660.1 hypothetical protein Acsp06_58450 [Actinomycetospora sp. NBRC 106375]
MDTVPERRPTEAYDLAAAVVALSRRDVPRVTLLAALDQARTSLRREPHRDVRRTLTWVVGAVERGESADACVDAALRVAARDLGRPPSAGYAR